MVPLQAGFEPPIYPVFTSQPWSNPADYKELLHQVEAVLGHLSALGATAEAVRHTMRRMLRSAVAAGGKLTNARAILTREPAWLLDASHTCGCRALLSTLQT